MEKETIGLKAIIMFDMLQVLLLNMGMEMMEICKKPANCHPISSPHIFFIVAFYVMSGRVMSRFITHLRPNITEWTCIVWLPNWGGSHIQEELFFPLSLLKKSRIREEWQNLREIWQTLGQKSERFSSQILLSLAGYVAD